MSKKFQTVKQLAFKYGADDIRLSKKKDKKYDVLYNGKWITFGQKGYQDYLDHDDPERRDRYRKRACKIKNGQGQYTYKNKNTANFWAYHVLW
jgi:hypothetical protein